MAGFSVAAYDQTSDVFREISDIWCYCNKSDVDWVVHCFCFSHFHSVSEWK